MFTDGDPALDTTDAKEMLVALVTGQEKMLERMDRLEQQQKQMMMAHDRERTSSSSRNLGSSREGGFRRPSIYGAIGTADVMHPEDLSRSESAVFNFTSVADVAEVAAEALAKQRGEPSAAAADGSAPPARSCSASGGRLSTLARSLSRRFPTATRLSDRGGGDGGGRKLSVPEEAARRQVHLSRSQTMTRHMDSVLHGTDDDVERMIRSLQSEQNLAALPSHRRADCRLMIQEMKPMIACRTR